MNARTTQKMRRALATAGLVVGLTAAAGCAGPASEDKTGGGTVLLRLATIDTVNNNGQSYGPEAFVSALEEVSEGRLQVDVDTETFGDGSATQEAELVTAISEGRVDGGWPSTRAFATGGIDGLEVVEAPLTLTSYDAVRDLVTSDVAAQLLGRLDDNGVIGLGLTVGPLRRPFAADEPLLAASDWAGQRFRSFNSTTQDAAIRALGAEPLHVGEDWPEAARTGDIDGLEFDVAQYHLNGMTTQAGHLTSNVVLWPKVYVLSLSRDRYEALTDQQQGWVQKAADRAVAASVNAEYDEATLVRDLCAAGLELREASAGQVRELREAVQPVLDDLARDDAWPEIGEIAAQHPRPEELDPDTCVRAPRVRRVATLRVPGVPTNFPDGVYRTEVTDDDLAPLGLSAETEGSTGVWTLTVEDGRFSIDCIPRADSAGVDCNYTERLGPDFDANPREVGGLYGTGNRVWFEHETATEHRLSDCTLPPSEQGETSCMWGFVHRLDWSLENDRLVMSNLVSTSPSYQLIVAPWERIS